jgi:ubiquinone/menaquinone biosynthesis C-methylase UbiE
VLDVGCANGRGTFQMARLGITVVGFDISEAMVRDAVRMAKANGLHAWTSFLVADADRLPFVDDRWDYAMTYGVLHHLPNPKLSCTEIQRILKVQGLFLACENNDSVLRPMFDWLMRISLLWNEKAGAEPLISDVMMHEWHIGLPVYIRAWRRVYLPPHLFNVLGFAAARWLMKITDAAGNSLPGIRSAAGLIFWEIRKNGNGCLAKRSISGLP